MIIVERDEYEESNLQGDVSSHRGSGQCFGQSKEKDIGIGGAIKTQEQGAK